VVAGEVALSEISEAEAAVPVEPVVETEAAPDVETGGVVPAALGAAGLAAGLEWALEDEEEQEATSDEASQGDLAVAPGSDQELAEELPLEEPAAEAPAAVDWLPEAEVADAKLVEPEEPPKDFWGKYNRKIVEVEGIGPAYTEKLTAYGITTTQGYLQQCATPRGRQELAAKTGISSKFILEWANHIDLMRIQGIGPQWAELLEAADVNTVREMALRNPKNLLKTMTELNESKKLVRQLPTLAQLEDWIEQAKELPRILDY
jgi:predicted flap endonuclease-1-like 5' DNA nuclease